MNEELQQHEIEDGGAEEHPPEDGVGSGEGAVGEGQDGDDHEEGHHRQEPRHQVRVVRQAPIPEIEIQTSLFTYRVTHLSGGEPGLG